MRKRIEGFRFRFLASVVTVVVLATGYVGVSSQVPHVDAAIIILVCLAMLVPMFLVSRDGNMRAQSGRHHALRIITGLRFSSIVSSACLFTIIWYLLQVNVKAPASQLFYLGPLLAISFLAAGRLSCMAESESRLSFLIALAPIFLGLNLIIVLTPPALTFGWDTPAMVLSTKQTIISGYPTSASIIGPFAAYYEQYPLLSVFTGIFTEIAHTDVIRAARLLPILFNFLALILLFLAIEKALGSRIVAAVAGFAYSSLPSATLNSTFVNSSVATPLMFGALFCVFAWNENKKTSLLAVSVILSLATVIAHALTPEILIIILLCVYLAGHIFADQRRGMGRKSSGEVVPLSSILVIAAAIAAYGAYLALAFWRQVGLSFADILTLSVSLTPLQGAAAPISQWFSTQFVLNILVLCFLAGLAMFGVLDQLKGHSLIALGLLVFSLFIAVFSRLTNAVPGVAAFGFPRAAIYIVPLLLGLSAYALQRMRIPIRAIVLLMLLVFFVSVQVYSIQPDYYDRTLLQTNSGYSEQIVYFTPKEVTGVTWIHQPALVVGDFEVLELISGYNPSLTWASDRNTVGIYEANFTSVSSYNLLVITSNDFRTSATNGVAFPVVPRLTNSAVNEILASPLLSLVYENGGVMIFRTS